MKQSHVGGRAARAQVERPALAVVAVPDTGDAAAPAADRDERVRRAAYALYERRGRGAGMALEDWLQAEAQIAAECP